MSTNDQVELTDDGTPTIVSGKFGKAFHSTHGAVQESLHVFIDAGLSHLIQKGKNQITVFEMGFGSGLNALLTCNAVLNTNVEIDYHSVELFPVDESVFRVWEAA